MTQTLTDKEQDLQSFCRLVRDHFRAHGRDLPWRRTHNPYYIMVSEFMLQQTQVPRVLPKYEEFIALFPSLETLAAAPIASVLAAWQGLGYNRRALNLQRTARLLVDHHGGAVPRSPALLRTLPGIGPATAAAIAAFAYGEASPFLETNIRAAFLHFFFPDESDVSDAAILPLVESTLDRADPRTWYYALMDYGAWLKKIHPNPSRRSAHHAVQSPYEGSRRQLRAQILRLFLDSSRTPALASSGNGMSDCNPTHNESESPPTLSLSADQVTARLSSWSPEQVQGTLESLVGEGFLRRHGTDDDCFSLA